MKIALVDDNEKDLAALKAHADAFAGKFPDTYTVDVFSDSMQFIENFDGSYDAVFLDIEMPLIGGMDVAKRLRAMGSDCCIIFVADTDRYAVQGYEVEALGYLLKPVSAITFGEILKKAEKRIRSLEKREVKIILQNRNGIKIISSARIYYLEVTGHDVALNTCEGVFTLRKPLKELENELIPVNFMRCNNCYLVNFKYVDYIKDDIVCVRGKELIMSRNRKKEFINAYLKYVN